MSTVLVGLLSFMCEEKPTVGSIRTSLRHKKMLAKRSWIHNVKNKTFCKLFPELAKRANEIIVSYSLHNNSNDDGIFDMNHDGNNSSTGHNIIIKSILRKNSVGIIVLLVALAVSFFLLYSSL